jgi:phage-related minor tail protein
MSEVVDLNFVARQLERVLAEIGSVRDDMRVLTAMTLRVDHGQARMAQDIHLLTDEVRAMHQQHARFHDRLATLEGE